MNAIASIGGAPPERVAFQESIEPVTDLIRPRPIYDSTGRFAAYEIQPANSSANLARLGLMPGDRLVTVNGGIHGVIGDRDEEIVWFRAVNCPFDHVVHLSFNTFCS